MQQSTYFGNCSDCDDFLNYSIFLRFENHSSFFCGDWHFSNFLTNFCNVAVFIQGSCISQLLLCGFDVFCFGLMEKPKCFNINTNCSKFQSHLVKQASLNSRDRVWLSPFNTCVRTESIIAIFHSSRSIHALSNIGLADIYKAVFHNAIFGYHSYCCASVYHTINSRYAYRSLSNIG